MKYNKKDFEKLVMVQLKNLNAQGKPVRLSKEQNELNGCK